MKGLQVRYRPSDPEWNPHQPQVPVDENGNWLSYPDYFCKGWTRVYPFHAVMVIDGMRTGRSSKVVVLKDTATDKRYPMFVADLVKGVQQGTLGVSFDEGEGVGKISAWWTASKKGANYGIKSIPAPH